MAPPPDLPSPTRLGAYLALAASAVGFAVGCWLTRVKFGADFWCETSGCLGGVQSAWFGCDEALSSPWSEFLGVPWSLWATGHSLAVAVMALRILRGRGAWSLAAPHGLAALAVVAVLTSTSLGAYALTNFERLCPYCLVLYAVSAVWLLAAWLVARARPAREGAAIGLLHAATLSLALTAAGTLAYRLASYQATCPLPGRELPAGAIGFQVEAPRSLVLLFVDPSCPKCARETHILLQNQELLRQHGASLAVYLFPRALCDEARLPAHDFVDGAGRELVADEARFHHACLAASAAICAEKLAPGRGLAALAALMSQPDRSSPLFPWQRVAHTLAAVDPRLAAAERLEACVNADATRAELAAHQRYYLDWAQRQGGKVGVPGAFVAPVRAGKVQLTAAHHAQDAAKLLRLVQQGDR